MGFRNRTRDNFEWDTEDRLIDTDPGIHPELGNEFQVALLEEDTLGPSVTMDTETIEPNAITSVSNSDVTHNPGLCDDSITLTPILFPINLTHETHINE